MCLAPSVSPSCFLLACPLGEIKTGTGEHDANWQNAWRSCTLLSQLNKLPRNPPMDVTFLSTIQLSELDPALLLEADVLQQVDGLVEKRVLESASKVWNAAARKEMTSTLSQAVVALGEANHL